MFLQMEVPRGRRDEDVVEELGELVSEMLRSRLDFGGAGRDPLQFLDFKAVEESPSQPLGEQSISVVVCTRDRPETLADCLASLKRMDSFQLREVIVVDNAPSSDATRRCFEEMVVDDERFRYVLEPKKGLSNARNKGLACASGTWVAFTDDDVVVDPKWLSGIARGIARTKGIGCVTGLVAAARLDTPAERFFEKRTAWSSFLEPRVYDLRDDCGISPLFPLDAGRFGTGANFALQRELAMALGGFDPALGAGSLARGGEDLDMFVRILSCGARIAYEPSAVVWHFHRVEERELRKQLYGYAVGLGAYLTKQFGTPRFRKMLLRGALNGAAHMMGIWNRSSGEGLRARIVLLEAIGLLKGPFAFSMGSLKRQPVPW
jgi:GT2 family glycosyltransferase